MKNFFNKIFLGTALSGLVITSGCKKQLDINVDPNNPPLSQGNNNIVFPAGVLGTAAGVGGEYAILGSIWGEYVTQSALSNQYKTISAYQLTKSDINGAYSLLFTRGAKNFQFVIDNARASENWSFYLMGVTMKAYTIEVLVDLYDKIPYFEALQGLGNLNPKFDDGYSVYKDLISSIDTALSKDLTPPLLTPAEKTADLVFNRDTDKWIRFANSLKLKMYLRMINAKPDEASAGITSLLNSNALFLDADAGLTGFSDAPGSDNPMYEQNIRQLNTPDNIRASYTFVSYLTLNADPRIEFYFNNPAPIAIHQGDYAGTDASYRTAAVLVENPGDPVIFMSLAESYFMQAEALERYKSGNGAKEMYDAGVLAAFSATGEDGSAFIAPGGVYEYPSTGTLEEKIEAISVQKWISCAYGVHFLEGFFEKNRTGYPKTSQVYSTDADYVPGQFVVSINSVLDPGKLPQRLPFPDLERQTNSNTPSEVAIDVPVWWAK